MIFLTVGATLTMATEQSDRMAIWDEKGPTAAQCHQGGPVDRVDASEEGRQKSIFAHGKDLPSLSKQGCC